MQRSTGTGTGFNPAIDISDWFWDIIRRAERDSNRLHDILMEFSEEKLCEFALEFSDAAVALQNQPYRTFANVSSEDGLEEISWWVVSQGKDYYAGIWSHPENMPTDGVIWGQDYLYGVAEDVYEERFGDLATFRRKLDTYAKRKAESTSTTGNRD